MGKILVIFLSCLIALACGFRIQNPSQDPQSNSTGEIPNEFQSKIRELETFREEFKSFKTSFVELATAFGRFHQSLTKNETEKVKSTTPSTTQKPENPAVSSCSAAMEILSPPRSKKHTIYPHGSNKSVEVLCDFETDGGGWTIIQKRSSGPQQEFNRDWNDYAKGFGSRAGNFWLGLENIRALTKNGDQELRIELEDFEGNKKYAKYSSFSISDASDFYRLSLSGYYGNSTVDDAMVLYGNQGKQFSTRDKDNDGWVGVNCAKDKSAGGWWFNTYCGASYLNGLYRERGETVPSYQGIIWWPWKGSDYSLAKTEIKIRTRK